MTGEHIRGIPRTYEKEITLADTPYTLSVGFNCVKVDTTGGNVLVNLPNVNYPIDVIKTSSDSYIVTVWVASVQIGEVAGPMSKITIENAEVTKDEPWFPYDAIVGIAGVSGDGGEVLAKDRYGRVIAGGRGVAGTDDASVIQLVLSIATNGYIIKFGNSRFVLDTVLNIPDNIPLTIEGSGWGTSFFTPASSSNALFGGSNLYKCVFRDFSISAGASATGNLFNFQNTAKHCIFDHLYVRDIASNGYAIYITKGSGTSGPYENIIINCSTNCLAGYAAAAYTLYYAGSELLAINNKFSNSRIRTASSGYVNISDNIFENANILSESSSMLSICGNLYSNSSSMSGVKQITIYNYTNANVCGNIINGNSYILDGIALTGSTSNSILEGNRITGCTNAIKEYGTNNYNMFVGNMLIGNTNAIVRVGSGDMCIHNLGYTTYNDGSSTGTGSEQTIAHGLAAIPTGCKAWITYLVGTRYVTEMIPFDATNVYPTVDNGVAYYWRIE